MNKDKDEFVKTLNMCKMNLDMGIPMSPVHLTKWLEKSYDKSWDEDGELLSEFTDLIDEFNNM